MSVCPNSRFLGNYLSKRQVRRVLAKSLTSGLFYEMVERVGPLIHKKDTSWRKALDPGLKLAITLRYLATGDSYKSLQYGFRVAVNTICNLIPATCQAIIEVYMEECIQPPMTPATWEEVAEGFSKRWNFHNCLGAVDGKHVAI